jgi:hypothetical protein
MTSAHYCTSLESLFVGRQCSLLRYYRRSVLCVLYVQTNKQIARRALNVPLCFSRRAQSNKGSGYEIGQANNTAPRATIRTSNAHR